MPSLGPGSRLALALCSIAFLFALLGAALSWRIYANERDHKLSETAQLAETAARNADRFVQDRLVILNTIAAAPSVRASNLDAMLAFLQELNPEDLGFGGGVGWVDLDGWVQVFTEASDDELPLYVGDREHIQGVLTEQRPFVGEAVIGRREGFPILPFAVPTFDATGSLTGVLIGTIRLDVLGSAAKEQRFGVGDITIIDQAGNVIAWPRSMADLINVSDAPLMTAIGEDENAILQGVTGLAGDDNRIVAYANAPASGWTVLIERSPGQLFGNERRTLIIELVGITTAFVAVLIGGLAGRRRVNRSAAREAAALGELEVREERLRALTEATTRVVWTVDSSGELRDLDQRWSALTGLTPDQLDRGSWLSYVHVDDREPGNANWQAGIQQGRMIEFEQRIIAGDGQERNMQVRAVPVREANGRIREWIGVDIDVTEQRRAEAALRERETFARDVLDSLFVFVGVLTPDGALVQANRAALRIAGLPEDDVLGRPFWETHWWSYSPVIQQQLREAIAGARAGEFVRFDVDVRIRGDQFITIDFAIGVIRDPAGAIQFLVPSATDITERTQAERAVAESEERYRALVEATSTVVWRTTADGELVFGGDAWERITGQTQEEMVGWGWLDVVHPDDREQTIAAWQASLESREPHENEIRVRQRDGTYRYFSVRGVPVFNADGTVREWVGANTDLHDRRVAEHSLRETAERLSLALEAGQLDTWDWDIQSDNIEWSESAQAVIGPTPESIERFVETIHPDDQETVRAAIWRSLEERAPYEVEYRTIDVSGQERWLYVRGEAFHDDVGRPLRMLGVYVDITDRKSREAFEQAFIANVAHDIKNPLSAVKAQTQLLRRRLKSGRLDVDSLDSTLGVLDAGLVRINRRIEELADVARLRAGRELELRKAPVDLNGLVRGIVETYQQATDRHTITLDTPEPELVGLLDGDRIERVIDNLISNAVKYSPGGGDIHIVAVRASDNPNWIRVTVVDYGIGIPSADLPHIFERYRRAGNTFVISGTGIGLAGSRHIVEQHGGTIEVESHEAEGSTFTVHLPLTQSDPADQERPSGTVIDRGADRSLPDEIERPDGRDPDAEGVSDTVPTEVGTG